MCLPYYALPAERRKTFTNAFKELSSASRIDCSASFGTVVPKAVEKYLKRTPIQLLCRSL